MKDCFGHSIRVMPVDESIVPSDFVQVTSDRGPTIICLRDRHHRTTPITSPMITRRTYQCTNGEDDSPLVESWRCATFLHLSDYISLIEFFFSFFFACVLAGVTVVEKTHDGSTMLIECRKLSLWPRLEDDEHTHTRVSMYTEIYECVVQCRMPT